MLRLTILLAAVAAAGTYVMPTPRLGGRALAVRPSRAMVRPGASITMRDNDIDTKAAIDLGSWALGGAALGSLIGTSPAFAGATMKFLPILTGLIGGVWRATAMRLGELHVKWVRQDDTLGPAARCAPHLARGRRLPVQQY